MSGGVIRICYGSTWLTPNGDPRSGNDSSYNSGFTGMSK